MPAFLKQPISNTSSKLCAIGEYDIENFFSMIQSRCSIYSHYNEIITMIDELWHQELTVMKITVDDFEKIVSPFLASHIYKLVGP